MTSFERSTIFWFGDPPTDQECTEIRNRHLFIQVVSDSELPDFNLGRGVIYCARAPHVSLATAGMGELPAALDHGLLVYLLAGDDAIQQLLIDLIPPLARDSILGEQIRKRTGFIPPHECAETIARHDPGPHAEKSLEIVTPKDIELTLMQEFLIRRAFNDCATVSIEPLSGGRSASAFSVQARLKASAVGPRPLPFFMKLDEPRKIIRELSGYQIFAANHIPWYLRPNLDPHRCLLGNSQGILVGSFVGQSDSLWDAVLDGRGPRYIHALFEETLMGWRSQAYQEVPKRGRLASDMSQSFDWKNIQITHLDRAKEFGDVLEPRSIWETMLSLKEQVWRSAPMHGDLHGENVRVRNGDAIIIDLANVGTGPLSADIANLEVWLSFELPPHTRQALDQDVWTTLVGELYAPEAVRQPPYLSSSEVGIDWLRSCLRQTRMLGNAICECNTEYPTAIAIHLLRRACYQSTGSDSTRVEYDSYRRAFAYYLGSNLVKWLMTAPVIHSRTS